MSKPFNLQLLSNPTACDLVPKSVCENINWLKEILFCNKYSVEHVLGPGEFQRSFPSWVVLCKQCGEGQHLYQIWVAGLGEYLNSQMFLLEENIDLWPPDSTLESSPVLKKYI